MRSGARQGLEAVVAATVMATLATGCEPASGPVVPEVAGPPLAVTRGALEERIVLTGELEADRSEDLVAPRTEGWGVAIRWLAEDGALVRKGDKVVELDNTAVLETISDLELAVIQAGTELDSQRATAAVAVEDKRFEVETQRIALAKARLDAEVLPTLVSRREYQKFQLAVHTATTALATAEDDLRAAREGARLETEVKRIALLKAERKLESAREEVAALSLAAPRDGVVLVGTHPWEGRKLQVGDTVWPGLPVARLPDLGAMVVKAVLSDVDDGRVRPGMVARCLVDAWPERPLDAKVLAVSPVAREPEHQSTRRFFSVVLPLTGDLQDLRPGLSVKVEVLVARHEAELLVPRVALDTSTEPARAWLAAGSAVDVELGPCDALQCVVLAGLAEGDALAPVPGGGSAG